VLDRKANGASTVAQCHRTTEVLDIRPTGMDLEEIEVQDTVHGIDLHTRMLTTGTAPEIGTLETTTAHKVHQIMQEDLCLRQKACPHVHHLYVKILIENNTTKHLHRIEQTMSADHPVHESLLLMGARHQTEEGPEMSLSQSIPAQSRHDAHATIQTILDTLTNAQDRAITASPFDTTTAHRPTMGEGDVDLATMTSRLFATMTESVCRLLDEALTSLMVTLRVTMSPGPPQEVGQMGRQNHIPTSVVAAEARDPTAHGEIGNDLHEIEIMSTIAERMIIGVSSANCLSD
jgi:hypothetical protein